MISNRREFAQAQLGVFGASFAAWLAIAASSHWLGGYLPAFLCGSAQAPWLTAGWALSASLSWLLMIVSMMGPMTLPAIVHIRISVFARRRLRATSLFFVGFAALWLVPGLAMKTLETTLQAGSTADAYGPATVAALIACIWQCSPFKQRCLNRCHTHRPLQAFGVRADLDALRLGLEHGLWCVGTCWALMLLTVLLPQWHPAIMPVVAALTFCERLDPPKSPAWQIRGLRTASAWLRREIAHAGSCEPWRQGRQRPDHVEKGLV